MLDYLKNLMKNTSNRLSSIKIKENQDTYDIKLFFKTKVKYPILYSLNEVILSMYL
jgi:hypothetical protein